MSSPGQQLNNGVESVSPLQNQINCVDNQLEAVWNRLLTLTKRLECVCQPQQDQTEETPERPEECVPLLRSLRMTEEKIGIIAFQLDGILNRLQL